MKPDETSEISIPVCSSVSANVFENGAWRATFDCVAEEQPVAIEFNGVSHAVMLATPADLQDFGLGFALTEGIIDTSEQCFDIEETTCNQGVTVKIQIASSCFARLKQKRRNLAGRTGCGLCGAESLTQVLRPLRPLASEPHQMPLPHASLQLAIDSLHQHQSLQIKTGATHAAAWFDMTGQARLIREDVGRHNALDKLIGAGMRSDLPNWKGGFLFVTSRASMEMVQKSIIAGFSVLAAISAPTKLAIDLAQENGLCLIGFARSNKWTVYTHPERLETNP